MSKHTGKVRRNGRTRATGRNEAVAGWYRGDVPIPKTISNRYLNQDERVAIAGGNRTGDSLHPIARHLGRNVSVISREVHSNQDPTTGRYEPHRAQQASTVRLARPKPTKIATNPALRAATLLPGLSD